MASEGVLEEMRFACLAWWFRRKSRQNAIAGTLSIIVTVLAVVALWTAIRATEAHAAFPDDLPFGVDSVSIAHSSPKGISASIWFAAKATPDVRWAINADRLGQADPTGSISVIYVVPGDFIGWKGYLGASGGRYFKSGQNELQVILGARILWFFVEEVFPLDTGNPTYTRVGVRIDL